MKMTYTLPEIQWLNTGNDTDIILFSGTESDAGEQGQNDEGRLAVRG